MRCPRCLAKLVKLKEGKKYQTFVEHCSDPNADRPERPAYVCPNGCLPGFFGIDGGHYGVGDELYQTAKHPEWWYAVNSFEWRVHNWDLWHQWEWKTNEILEAAGKFMERMEHENILEN